MSSPKTSVSSPEPGSKWITFVDGFFSNNGVVLSAYYHPTKTHSASIIGSLGTKKSVLKKENGQFRCNLKHYTIIRHSITHLMKIYDSKMGNMK